MADTDKPDGLAEAPQRALEGEPLSSDLSSWAQEIAQEADRNPQGVREDVAEEARRAALGVVEADERERAEAKKRKARIARKKPVHGSGKGGRVQKGDSFSPFDVSGAPKEIVGDKRTGGGTQIGGTNDPRERVAAGLNPVAGLDVSLEDAERMSTKGVTATVQALSELIEHGREEMKGDIWVPHRPARPDKSEGGRVFKMVSEFEPKGDQPTAIKDLVEGLRSADGSNVGGERTQTLLGVTGSGKTFTMGKVIEETQRPALILAPNKTLAAQLYGEMKSFFPDNAVEYFVSYYDYYQPEAYVPRSDTYIEKESSINEQIDRMRHSATRALLERDDVVIVASVSCIYGIGSVETYTAMTFSMAVGDRLDQRQLLADLVAQQYRRRDMDFTRGSFRVRGDTIEIFPAHLEDRAWRISLWGDEIERITEFDPLTGQKTDELKSVKIYANSHYVTPRPTLNQAMRQIKEELEWRLDELTKAGRLLEAQRLEQRTRFDLEMMEATGACNCIEN